MDIATERASYKIQLLGNNVYSGQLYAPLPAVPLIPFPLASNGLRTHRVVPTTVILNYMPSVTPK